MDVATESLEGWDPLDTTAGADPGMLISAQRREISNILRSYTGYYDLLAELLQNALDAVEKRLSENPDYTPHIWIEIDLKNQSVQVTDNGCGMTLQQLRQFLRPNFSFKTGSVTRGSKGVGATYLGYGFNSLAVSTRVDGKTISGQIDNGRRWVDDNSGTVPRPVINARPAQGGAFTDIDQGTAITVKLIGENIRPRNLGWYQATTADQWLSLLRIMTAIGGIYIDGTKAPKAEIRVHVIDSSGTATEASLPSPEYLYPHLLIQRSGSMVEFLKDQKEKMMKGADLLRHPLSSKDLMVFMVIGRILNYWERRKGTPPLIFLSTLLSVNWPSLQDCRFMYISPFLRNFGTT